MEIEPSTPNIGETIQEVTEEDEDDDDNDWETDIEEKGNQTLEPSDNDDDIGW